jgi:U4/U6.U5 tri-snRNP-associated protein 1
MSQEKEISPGKEFVPRIVLGPDGTISRRYNNSINEEREPIPEPVILKRHLDIYQENKMEDPLSWVHKLRQKKNVPMHKVDNAPVQIDSNDAHTTFSHPELPTHMQFGASEVLVLEDVSVMNPSNDDDVSSEDVLYSIREKEIQEDDRNQRKRAQFDKYNRQKGLGKSMISFIDSDLDDENDSKLFSTKKQKTQDLDPGKRFNRFDSVSTPITMKDTYIDESAVPKNFKKQFRKEKIPFEDRGMIDNLAMNVLKTKQNDNAEDEDLNTLQNLIGITREKELAIESIDKRASENHFIEPNFKDMKSGLVFSEAVEFTDRIASIVTRKKYEPTLEEATEQVTEQVNGSSSVQDPIKQDNADMDVPDSEEPLIRNGIGSTLLVLKMRGILREATEEERSKSANFDKRNRWLVAKSIIQSHNIPKKPGKASGRNRSKDPESAIPKGIDPDVLYKEHLEQIEEQMRTYNPQITLKYQDESGRELTTKEAYKELSHKFHGTSPGKKKAKKRAKKPDSANILQQNSTLPSQQKKAVSEEPKQQTKQPRVPVQSKIFGLQRKYNY